MNKNLQTMKDMNWVIVYPKMERKLNQSRSRDVMHTRFLFGKPQRGIMWKDFWVNSLFIVMKNSWLLCLRLSMQRASNSSLWADRGVKLRRPMRKIIYYYKKRISGGQFFKSSLALHHWIYITLIKTWNTWKHIVKI